jgi:hypothetical protein
MEKTKNFQPFMEAKCSEQRSQQYDTNPILNILKPVNISELGVCKIHFNIIFSFMPRSLVVFRNWGSSVSIVSEYRLYDRGSIPDRGKEFFL